MTLLSVQAKRPYPDRSVLIPLVKVLNKFLHVTYINFEYMLTTSLTTISVHIHWNERGTCSYFVNPFECWSSKRNLTGTVKLALMFHIFKVLPLVFHGIDCSLWTIIVKTLIGLHTFKAAFIRQMKCWPTCVDKLKLVCVNGTTCWQSFGNTQNLSLFSPSFSLLVVVSFTHTNCCPRQVGQHLFAAGEGRLKCTKKCTEDCGNLNPQKKNTLKNAEIFCGGMPLDTL